MTREPSAWGTCPLPHYLTRSVVGTRVRPHPGILCGVPQVPAAVSAQFPKRRLAPLTAPITVTALRTPLLSSTGCCRLGWHPQPQKSHPPREPSFLSAGQAWTREPAATRTSRFSKRSWWSSQTALSPGAQAGPFGIQTTTLRFAS